jgi:hypothetical protein
MKLGTEAHAPGEPKLGHRRDAGVTFVETVLTVVLIGVVIVPVLAAVRSAIKTSTVVESAAQVETVLIDAADRVHRSPNGGSGGCSFTGDAQAAAESVGWPAASVTVRHEYLDEAGQWTTGTVPALPACPDGLNRLGLAKRITITVTDPDGRVSRTIQMVKSDV